MMRPLRWPPLKPKPMLSEREMNTVLDAAEKQPEYTGGSVSYYTVRVENPTTPARQPYTAECNDIIEALGMSFAEGEAFKAIWRMAAARQGRAKKSYTDGLYDAEKVQFFGGRLVAQAKARAEADSNAVRMAC